jgi:hypothetical protein
MESGDELGFSPWEEGSVDVLGALWRSSSPLD